MRLLALIERASRMHRPTAWNRDELAEMLPRLRPELERHAEHLTWTLGARVEAAEDVVQDVFVKVLERPELLPRKDGERGVVRYARCMVTSAMIDVRRRDRAAPFESWEQNELERVSESLTATGIVTRVDQVRFVRKLIEMLPAEHKVVLELVAYEGLEFQQVGEVLAISARVARRRFEQVKHALERRLRNA